MLDAELQNLMFILLHFSFILAQYLFIFLFFPLGMGMFTQFACTIEVSNLFIDFTRVCFESQKRLWA
jgi:hypothetical protein